ncbi:MAG: putative photosynthetic complex assembly protein PuhE [Steroidobacteraceae bacterium]
MSGVGHWAPVIYLLLLWWFTTGLILWLDRRGATTRRWSLIVASALAVASLWASHATRDQASVTEAYVAFTSAVLVWGLIELAFLTGTVTGPRRLACPEGAEGWPRFKAAVGVLLYHEIALLFAALTLYLLVGVDGVAFQAFAALWIMRQSAKLNLFLGVRNPGEQFLPERLAYLASYFRRRSMNLLFPWSVLFLSIAAGLLGTRLMGMAPSEPAATQLVLLTTLVVLGLIEHWFLVLPIRVDALWAWSLRSQRRTPLRVDSLRALPGPRRGIT